MSGINPTRWIRPVAGLFLVVFGAWLMYLATSDQPIERFRVWVAVGVMVGGALLILPVKDTKTLADVIGTYVPQVGGRRPADPIAVRTVASQLASRQAKERRADVALGLYREPEPDVDWTGGEMPSPIPPETEAPGAPFDPSTTIPPGAVVRDD